MERPSQSRSSDGRWCICRQRVSLIANGVTCLGRLIEDRELASIRLHREGEKVRKRGSKKERKRENMRERERVNTRERDRKREREKELCAERKARKREREHDEERVLY